MRTLLLALPLLALLFVSCDEPFTPKAPFTPQPTVTCIVAGSQYGGTSNFSVTATVAHTYDVPALDPLANTKDPFDTNAVVILNIGGDLDTLRLQTSKRTDTSRYTTREYRFSASGQLPVFSAKGLALSVRTGSGAKLSATTTVPKQRIIETSYDFAAGVTSLTTEPLWTFSWDEGQRDDRLYFPKMLLSYQIINGASIVNKTVEIPLRYIDREGKKVAVYPSFTRSLSLVYEFSALGTAIASISEGDPDKSRYKIGRLAFTLIEYDLNLSNYYSSSHGYLDEYSIRVDETTYSNISGGIGIFGSYFTNILSFEMKAQFIQSFGYTI